MKIYRHKGNNRIIGAKFEDLASTQVTMTATGNLAEDGVTIDFTYNCIVIGVIVVVTVADGVVFEPYTTNDNTEERIFGWMDDGERRVYYMAVLHYVCGSAEAVADNGTDAGIRTSTIRCSDGRAY